MGIYHSHPDSPASPSEYDRDHAWPWFSYIIVSVNAGIAAEALAWKLRDDRSGFDRLIVEENGEARMSVVKVEIPTALRAFAGNKDTVPLEGETVGELLTKLGAAFPQLKKHIFDEQDRLRSFVNVYVNDDDIKHLDKERTRVSAKDVVSIIPSVAEERPRRVRGKRRRRRCHAQPAARSSATAGTSSCRRSAWTVSNVAPRARCSMGAGGLGSPVLSYLAAAGWDRLGSWISTRWTSPTSSARSSTRPRMSAGPSSNPRRDRISPSTPTYRSSSTRKRSSSENTMAIFAGYDIVIDGTDNFPTRYLVNDACVMLGMPNVYGEHFPVRRPGVGFYPETARCYRCVYPEPPPPG